MLDVLVPMALGVVCICWSLFLWFRVRTNYERWKGNPLFFDPASFGAKNPERAWRIYINLSLISMNVVALVIIILWILGYR